VGSIYRKTVTKPLPNGAAIVTRNGRKLAKWADRRGRTRTAEVNASGRIVVLGKYIAKYRGGRGVVVEVATGCAYETAARAKLAELERRAELVRAGVLTAEQDRTADHAARTLADHVAEYLDHLRAKGVADMHHSNVTNQLGRVVGDCGWRRLADLDAGPVERWMVRRAADEMAGRTRNTYLAALVAFANWCVREGRLTSHPFGRVPKADEKSDQRRKRRAMSEPELIRLLDVARDRPLIDAMTIRHGPRTGQVVARLTDDRRARLTALGRERALMYKTLVLTGLRRGELASLTVGRLDLDAAPPWVVLRAADEKSREGNEVALRPDLADDLRSWVAGRAD
jgi:integrase